MIRVVVLACVALGIALIALLFRASSNNAFFAEHYTWLFWLASTLTVGLLALIVYQVWSLWRKLKRRVFGAKLALRLMAVFALMAVIPGGLVYTISVQFLNRSIDSWFDVPVVDKAFESALRLGKSALEASLNDLSRHGRAAAERLGELPAQDADLLRPLRTQLGADEVAVVAADGTVLALASGRTRLFPDKPSAAEIREASKKGLFKSLETQSDRSIYLRALLPLPSSAAATRFLHIVQAAPKDLVKDEQSVDAGISDYQQLVLQREGLKQLFALTLTLAMLLTLFSAISLSFLLSDRLSAPLSALAESTRAIAKGDFTKLNPVKSRDEFGVLTQSFNTMTRQLAEASDVVARKQIELESANTYLESILGRLTSGVVTLDEQLYVKTINASAQAMLGIDPQAVHSRKFSEWGELVTSLAPLIADIGTLLGPKRDRPWERQFAYQNEGGPRTLLVRGTKLPATIDSGYVIVFDDITGLIQAQRDAAWGEVARRLAHEIKNPLTPIQLSAERLQMKLSGKLPEAERDILARATQTIVAQVGALKGMVDDFSLYSRASRLAPSDVDLNELVREVLVLYESMNVAIDLQLQEGLAPVFADPALLRQVLHNLIQNALDALIGIEHPRLLVSTQTTATGAALVIEDNGSGIREDVIAHIFEPYVTTKPRGTGLGLAIVKKIIDEHRGTIAVANAQPHGARVTIELTRSFDPTLPVGARDKPSSISSSNPSGVQAG